MPARHRPTFTIAPRPRAAGPYRTRRELLLLRRQYFERPR